MKIMTNTTKTLVVVTLMKLEKNARFTSDGRGLGDGRKAGNESDSGGTTWK